MSAIVTPITASPPTLGQPKLRPARFEDFPHIQQLEAKHDLLTLAEEDWRSIWLGHPMSPQLQEIGFPIGWVLEDSGGLIVGSMMNVPSQYAYRDRILLAATGRGWVVEPSYRGMALWLMDEYFNQTNVDLFINTTVNSMAVDPFSVFGSSRVPVGDWTQAAYRISNHAGFARTALRIKQWPQQLAIPVAMMLKLRDSLRPPRSAIASGSLHNGSDFDERFDQFWKSLRAQRAETLLAVRDCATLRWHFAGPMRDGELWVYWIEQGGTVRAYAIAKRQDHPPSGLRRMRLVDYQSLEAAGNDPHQLPLIRAIYDRCVAEKIHVFEHVGCALPKIAAFDSFAPYRRDLPAWPYYFKAADESLHAELANADRWDPSTFDGDASL